MLDRTHPVDPDTVARPAVPPDDRELDPRAAPSSEGPIRTQTKDRSGTRPRHTPAERPARGQAPAVPRSRPNRRRGTQCAAARWRPSARSPGVLARPSAAARGVTIVRCRAASAATDPSRPTVITAQSATLATRDPPCIPYTCPNAHSARAGWRVWRYDRGEGAHASECAPRESPRTAGPGLCCEGVSVF